MTGIEFKESKNYPDPDKTPFTSREISPIDRLGFAGKIMTGLCFSFCISTAFIFFNKDDYGKIVFVSSLQLINTFGSFVMGFYFSSKK